MAVCISFSTLLTLIYLTGLVEKIYGTTNLLALIPMSGDEAMRGKAELLGIQLALRDRPLPSADTRLIYNDSQCDVYQEGKLVLQQTISSRSHLVVLGGGCRLSKSTRLQQDSYGVLRSIVPQVTFEEVAPDQQEGSNNFISTRPSIFSTHDAIVAFLKKHRWRQLVLIHQRSGIFAQGSLAIQELFRQEGIEVKLTIPQDNRNLLSIISTSTLRVVLLYLDDTALAHVTCELWGEETQRGRHEWLIPRDSNHISTNFIHKCTQNSNERAFIFISGENFTNSQRFQSFSNKIQQMDPMLPDGYHPVSAYAYDTAKLVLTTLNKSANTIPQVNQESFAEAFVKAIKRSSIQGITGLIQFEVSGERQVNVSIFFQEGGRSVRMFGWFNRSLHLSQLIDGADVISAKVALDGVPLFLFVIMSSLAFLGIIYAVAILVFNLYKHTDRLIKMTSPNINVIIITGCVLAYSSIFLVGFDTSLVSSDTMARLLQASAYILTISFTFVYGSTFSKAWRVYLIFRNLNFNGKMTRDEHLLIGVLLLLLLDIILLLVWTFADPITCHRANQTTTFEEATMTDVVWQIDICSSKLQFLWITLVYLSKVVLMFMGLWVTWRTRRVTIPSLKDSKHIYIVIYTVVLLSIIGLPILLITNVSMRLKFAVGALIIFFVVTATLTLSFIPKIYLVWKQKSNDSMDAGKLHFTESMQRTQQDKSNCFPCLSLGDRDEDPYAQEILTTEIETLNRTIKEKDFTIRELTDRLYYGTEKFQEYLTSPKASNILYAMRRKHASRTRSQPPETRTRDSVEDFMVQYRNFPRYHGSLHIRPSHISDNFCDLDNYGPSTPIRQEFDVEELSVGSLSRSFNQHEKVCKTPKTSVRSPITSDGHESPESILRRVNITYDPGTKSRIRTPSPNNDSAIENNSPSSESSERGSYADHKMSGVNISMTGSQFNSVARATSNGLHQPLPVYKIGTPVCSRRETPTRRTPIDIDAMEKDTNIRYLPDSQQRCHDSLCIVHTQIPSQHHDFGIRHLSEV